MAEFPRIVRRSVDRQVSGHEGVDNRQIQYLLNPNQLADNTNLRTADLGKFRRRLGAAPRGGFSFDPGGGMVEFIDGNADKWFTTIWGGSLYKSQGGTAWLQIASGATFTSAALYHAVPGRISGNRAIGFTVAEDTTTRGPFVIYDAQNDASTFVSLAGRACAFFSQRFWVSDGDNLYWSDILDTAGFSVSGNVLAAEPGVGGDITALIPARDTTPRLYVLKDEAIMLLDPRWGSNSALIPTAGDALDTINSNFTTLTVGIGCVATKSAAWVPGNEGADVLFLAQDGIRGLRRAEQDAQAGAGFPESYGIDAWINRINFDAAHKAVGQIFDNAYHLAVPLDGATENTHVFRRDTAGGAWSLLDWQAKDMRAFRLGSGFRMFFQNNFTTDDSAGTGQSATPLYQVYRGYASETDPGATHVQFSFDTRAFVGQDPQREKEWDLLTFQVSSTATAGLEIQYRTNFGVWNTLATETIPGGSDSVVLGEDPLVWNASTTLARRKQYTLDDIGPSHSIQFRFNSITGATESGTLTLFMIDCAFFESVESVESEA